MKITEIKNLFLIKDDEYVMYNNFKRKVLLQAQKEINEKTDINISFNEIKI
jgi:plasmid replication initiation protein